MKQIKRKIEKVIKSYRKSPHIKVTAWISREPYPLRKAEFEIGTEVEVKINSIFELLQRVSQ